MKQNAIAIFDVGKTNKKLFLFDEDYNIIHEELQKFEEINDEDGFPCEDVHALTAWIKEKFNEVAAHKNFDIKAVNFSAYGASFVYLDENNQPLTPLYNYLRPYPDEIKNQFYNTYGSEDSIAKETASPVLGSLNSGMQLYRLKYEQPAVFSKLKHALHLPQYVSFLISAQPTSDITSIGCHTQLWHFTKNKYHDWVSAENIIGKLPPIYNSSEIFHSSLHPNIITGIGLHDSSAALIPYLKVFEEPFVLISTGTWCISLNPFNDAELTNKELENDCLCYLTFEGKQVKASRLFAGHEHEEQVKRLADHFNKSYDYYKVIQFEPALLHKAEHADSYQPVMQGSFMVQPSMFNRRSLEQFETYEEAYHQLMVDIVGQQVASTQLVLKDKPVKKIFVDGGFGSNEVFMKLLANSFPHMDVFTASIAQASAYGAAIAMHHAWNDNPLPNTLFNLKHFKVQVDV